MTEAEWRALLAMLSAREQWEEIWRLAQAAPATWSAWLLRRLKAMQWTPQSTAEQEGFGHLVQLAEQCRGQSAALRSLRLCQVMPQMHSARVSCLVWSQDGQILASGSRDSTIRLWHLPDRRALATLHGHTGGICCLAISPDGQLLASGGEDNTVRLWRLPDGQPLKSLQCSHVVPCLSISPDGQTLICGGSNLIQLWRLPGGKPLRPLTGHASGALCLAVSTDGSILASGGGDEVVRLWRLPDGTTCGTLAAPPGGVLCVTLSHDGGILASGSYDGTIRLWRLSDRTVYRTLQGPLGGVLCVAMSPDQGLITGLTRSGYDYTVHLWRLADSILLGTQEGLSSWMTCLALSPDGQTLASGSGNGTVCLWPSHFAPLSSLPIARTSVRDIAWVQETLRHKALTGPERAWLTFMLALMHWHRRFDIGLDTTTMSGEFDITLDE